MNCKNCDNTLRTDYSFCPDCGAKIIRQRLTFKNLTYDVFERYFNLDNTFLRTIWHMLIKPKEVCEGYILGLRKKYLNPISMLAISLTLSGFIVFVLKKVSWKDIDFSKITFVKTSNGSNGTEKIMSVTMEYSSFIFLLYIPVLAFASYALFNKKNYNLPEHIIITIYSLTTFSIISFLYSLSILLLSPQTYIDGSLIYLSLMIIYCLYVAYKNSNYKAKSLLWRIPIYLVIFFIGYLGVSIFTFVIFFITGEISPSDFIPKK